MSQTSRRFRWSRPDPSPAAPDSTLNTPRCDWRSLLCPALVFVLAVLVFAPTLGNDFVYDDGALVVRNPLITSLGQLPTLFGSSYWAGYSWELNPPTTGRKGGVYRPLVTFSFALNYAMGGLNPFGYHAVNLFLHAGVSLAVYGLGRRLLLTRAGAIVAAALFAVHPLHTEAVAGIVGRAELLMALGVLLALDGYVRGGAAARLGSLAAFVVGLMAKEQAAVLPGLLILTEVFVTRRSSWNPRWGAVARGALHRLLPYAGLLGAYLFLRSWVLGGVLRGSAGSTTSFLDNPLAHASLGSRFLTALSVAGQYLVLYLWPSRLSPDYSYNQVPLATSLFDGRVLLAGFLWMSLFTLAARSFTRGKGSACLAVAFTLLTFLPASNLIIPIGTIMGERLFYLPSVGLCWLAGLGWQAAQAKTNWPRLRKAAWAVFGVVLLALATQTVRYGRTWRDNATLFSYAVKVAPNSAKVHYTLGVHSKDPEAALREFEEAVQIYPEFLARHADFNVNLGGRLLHLERYDDATKALERAVALAPRLKAAHYNLGLAHARQARWKDAEASYRQALALDRGQASHHNSLSFVLRRQARDQEALAEAEEAIRLNPTFAEAHYNRAQALEALGRIRDAVAASERALALEPNLLVARQLLDRLRARVGK